MRVHAHTCSYMTLINWGPWDAWLNALWIQFRSCNYFVGPWPLSSLAYLMITHTPLIASNLLQLWLLGDGQKNLICMHTHAHAQAHAHGLNFLLPKSGLYTPCTHTCWLSLGSTSGKFPAFYLPYLLFIICTQLTTFSCACGHWYYNYITCKNCWYSTSAYKQLPRACLCIPGINFLIKLMWYANREGKKYMQCTWKEGDLEPLRAGVAIGRE